MQELGLIGLRIQRMPSEPNLEFGIPSQYSYMTVCLLPLLYLTQIQFRT
jgi:4-alpha-glucanotransferase